MNPALKEKGLLMVYNPLGSEMKKTLTIPLYYTGLKDKASVREQDKAAQVFTLDRECSIELPVKVQAHGVSWFVVE